MSHVGEAYFTGSVPDGALGVAVRPATDENPAKYLTIRLSNGTSFYTAGGTNVSGGAVLTSDQGAPGLHSSAWPVKLSDGAASIGVSGNPIVVTGSISLARSIAVETMPLADQGSPGLISSAWPVKITDGLVAFGTAAQPLNVTFASGGLSFGDSARPLWVTGSVAVGNQPTSTTVLSGSVVGLLVGGQPASTVNPSPIVPPRPTVANITSLTASVSSQQLVAANTARLGLTVTNNSVSAMYLKFGANASSSSFTAPLASNAYYEVPFGYAGRIDVVWAAANGEALVTEIVP